MPISQAPKRKVLFYIELEHFQSSDYAGAQAQPEMGEYDVADGSFGRDTPPCARATRVAYRAFSRLVRTTQASEKGSPSPNVSEVPARSLEPRCVSLVTAAQDDRPATV